MLKSIQFTPKRIIVIITVILFLFSMIFFISPYKVMGNGLPHDIYVDAGRADNSGDGTSWATAKKTISAGITAVTVAGIVHVASGTYTENVAVAKSVTITGSGSALTTVISSSVGNPVFSVTGANTLNISGFTVTGASGASLSGGGIYAGAGTTVVISECIISNNTAYEGGGIYCAASTLNISNSTIIGNHATSGGGGIQNSGGSITINNCKINSNFAASGVYGGGINNSMGSLDISNSEIKDNYASEPGAGIFGKGGGLYIKNLSGSVSINNCSIVNNKVNSPSIASSGIDANEASIIIDATNNWWGSSTGPSGGAIDPNTSNIANGSGDKIISSSSPNVRFDPWLTSDPFSNPTSKPLTPEDWVLMDLNITQLVDQYGASAEGFNKMLYDSILGRTPDEEGLSNWNNLLSNNLLGANQIVYKFVFSDELKDKISAMSNEEFINFLYQSLFARLPETEGYNDWLNFMKNGSSKEETLIAFLNSDEWLNICKMFGVNP